MSYDVAASRRVQAAADPLADISSLPPLLSRLPRRVVLVSYRLGGADGVSVEAAKWSRALSSLGAEVTTVAGAGRADTIVPGLAASPLAPSDPLPPASSVEDLDSLVATLETVLAPFDLVVVENALSLPLNPAAGRALARVLAGRPALLRHHDLASQRAQFRGVSRQWPPNDPFWRHVTINERSRLELFARGLFATTVYNRFDPYPPAGDRAATRASLGFGSDELVLLQPTRAIRRKNVPGGLVLATALGATYWLLGATEDGYGPELERVLSRAPGRVVLGVPDAPQAGAVPEARQDPAVPEARQLRAVPEARQLRAVPEEIAYPVSVSDAYAASDAVVLPSTWEGFGNPSIESALHRRPLAISDYPVAFELRRYGFSWFGVKEPEPLARFLQEPDELLLDRNQSIARARFSTDDLPAVLRGLLTGG